MATQTKVLGYTAPVTMGDWSATTTYNQLNWVRHKTATFISKVNYNKGVEPFVTAGWQNSWQLVAQDGDNMLGINATVLVNQTTGVPEATVTKTYDADGNAVFNFRFFNVKGEKGEDGAAVNIVQGIYYTSDNTNPPSGALPLPAFSSTTQGQAYVVDDTDIAGQYDLYFHGTDGTDWTIIDNWGGIPGQTPTISIGNVTLLPPLEPPSVTVTGTETAVVLNFGLPRAEAVKFEQSVPYSQSITVLSNYRTNIGTLSGSLQILLGSSIDGADNEWDFVISMGATTYAVTLPVIKWIYNAAPTFDANTTTYVALYYIGSTLCGVWQTI